MVINNLCIKHHSTFLHFIPIVTVFLTRTQVNNTIRDAEVYDVNYKKIVFADLFTASLQPYLLFDFCGTWCVPCIEEIKKYSKTKHLDKSSKVKPIWVFFENDRTKWLDAVEKYKLKKENCFMITGEASRNLIKEFSFLFNWGGEFPHYFLFSKDGRIIQKTAVSSSNFKENDISKK